jgi:predicted dithiol-disulfide oxidoreductase (DUF899 family)
MVEVDGATPLIVECGAVTLLEAFEGRRMLIAYYSMWDTGRPAPEQCEGCTFFTSQVRELSYIHFRDVTFAVFCQGPYEESARYCEFMGWEMPWYSAKDSLEHPLGRTPCAHDAHRLLPATRIQCLRNLLDDGSRRRAMDNSYRLLDLTAYGRRSRGRTRRRAGRSNSMLRTNAILINMALSSVPMDGPSSSGLA